MFTEYVIVLQMQISLKILKQFQYLLEIGWYQGYIIASLGWCTFCETLILD